MALLCQVERAAAGQRRVRAVPVRSVLELERARELASLVLQHL
jgi:hypothetical protein